MPIENERKFILRLDVDEQHYADLADRILQLEQGYLCRNDLTVRVRSSTNKKTRYYLTVKHTIDGKVIEIEKKISEADYKSLATVAKGWVRKTRYVIDDWEIDFFKTDGHTYFVMAEIELPDDVDEPTVIPDIVSDVLLHGVVRGDNRFSSKKLSDVAYAEGLITEITRSNQPGKNNRYMACH